MFVKTCQQCHTLFGQGNKVGPELTGSNRADLDYLLSNVLDPSALIAKDYMSTVIATTDGRTLVGIVRDEDANSVTLQTANEVLQIPLTEIDERQPGEKSMMPDDIFQPLKEHEIRALVAYLASPAQTPLLATADTIANLFNGRDLSGWTGNSKLWSVEDGEIVGRTDTKGLDHNEFLISDLLAGDFRLTLQVKLVGNRGNSGIQFRSKPVANGPDAPLEVQGYQADVGVDWWGKLYEEHGRGLLWSESGEAHVKPGEWNDYEIVATGSRIRTYINGQKCVDLNDPPGAKRGVFALQLHSGPATEVRFKNFKLELLPAEEQQAARR
jgi:putative heme-binding domain-containing protein